MLRLRPRHASFVLAASLFLGAASAARAQVARYSHTMTVMSDGNTLIVGGKGVGNTSLTTVDIYVSTGAKYETRAVLNTARSSHTATLLPDGQVLVTGGVDAAGTILNDGELYNPRLNTWTNVPTGFFAGPRVNHTATLLPNGKVLITGGQTDAAGNVLTSCALYEPSAAPFGLGSFSPCGAGGAMQMGRAAHTATLLHNGRVFVVGGYRGPASGFAPTTELYDFNTDTWLSGPAVSARAYHTAVQMGNQRVLISGGFNRVNLLENQGILSTNEIYDPNSNSIVGGTAPMAERRMMHTAVLGADGVVSLYGGLGNFTTTFVTGEQTMQDNSILRLNAVAGTWLNATVDNAPVTDTNLFIRPNYTLSVPANGTIVDGDINFSSPTMTGTDFRANFTYPNGTVAPLDGATLEFGVLENQTLEVATIGGDVAFSIQTVSSDDVLLTAVSQVTTAGAIGPAAAAPLTGGTLRGTILVPMPATNVGGTVLVGAAIISQGAISRISNDAVQGFDIALTSGVASIVGGNVVQGIDGPVMSLAVDFTGIEGTITNSTTTSIATPVTVTGLEITGLQVRLFYVVSPLNVSGLTLANDIATVTVRTMVFADQERYRPDQNNWAFGAPGDTLFNHGQTLLPNGDQFYYGGRTCTSIANCTAGTFTSQNRRSAYINLNHEVVSWQTTAGVLSAARSNLTLTQLPNGRVLAAGGANASTTLDASEYFDPVNRVWVPTAKMKRSRSHHTATLLANGNVLVAGGFTALGNSTGTTSHAEIFYPASNAWVHTAPMLSSRAFHAAVLLPEGNPMFLGGFSNGAYLSSTEVFYSTSHRWLQGPAMLEPRGQFTATVMHDGRILVVGGLNAANGVLNSTRFFDPTTLAWSAGGSLNFARHSHTATLLRDGRVIVIGGNDGTNEIALAEIFDPTVGANGTWSRVTTLGGNDLSIPRQNHTATLLPDGKIMVVGGFTALGGAITFNEGFDVDFSSFQMQGQFQQTGKRGDHATILLPDGNLLTAGGFDGLNYLSDTSLMYHGSFPDSQTLAGGLERRPRIDASRPAIIAPDTPVTVVGANFRGVTEASGGGSASQSSSHAHPRVYMNRMEAASSSGNDSGWMVDLTSGMFHSGVNSWTNMNSSLTFRVPETARKLPFGWYHLRVGANNQFSVSSMVLVGPQLPTGTPGIPVGTAVGASSVSWSWAAAAGTFDGYSVYSATSGVFISTVAKSGGATETFLQRELGPDTSTLIRIAAYNIAGDGSFAVSTVPVLTAVSNVNGLVGLAQDTGSIFWSWDPVNGAVSYEAYSASAGVRINSPVAANFTQTGLSTNTLSSVRVLAVMPGGPGTLSDSATAYTLAAPPVAASPGIINVSTGSFTAQWHPNGNPTDTLYHIQVLVGAETVPVQVSSISGLSAGLTTLEPNTKYTLSVAAYNGDGRYSGFASLSSTFTFARPPLNARILASDPSGVSLAWDSNGNPGSTPFQVLFSSNNFTRPTISTHIAFAAGVTTTSTNIGSLITGTSYFFRITAANGFGQETAPASTDTLINNGGGPAGSLSLLVPSTVYVSLAGTLSSARRFEIRIPERTFDVDTRVFISSRAVGVGGVNCGNIGAAFSITTLPAVQPRLPVEVGIQYVPGETGLGAVTTLGMARFDPVSGACVPMESRVDTTTNIVYARLNHFSDFQLQQLVPGAAVATARVFPNPLYTHTQPFFTFDHIPANAKIRIFTIHGEEVFEQGANASGIVTWRAENKVGRPVASGLYLAVVESGGEKKILKLAVVR